MEKQQEYKKEFESFLNDKTNIPKLVLSMVTIVFDLILLYQFKAYNKAKNEDEENEVLL